MGSASLLTRPFDTLLQVEHRPRFLIARRRAADGQAVAGVECRLGEAAACSHWVELDLSPRAGGGEGCVLVIRDVSERHALRHEVARRHDELQETLASLLDTIPVGIVITDDALAHYGIVDGETAFLPKPFDAPTLTRKVRELLDHVSGDDVGWACA